MVMFVVVVVVLLLAQHACCEAVESIGVLSVKELMRDDVCAADESDNECGLDLRQLRGEQQVGQSAVAASPAQPSLAMPPMGGDMMPDVAWGTLQSMQEWARKYDFAVRIRIGAGSCSGTLLGDKVLTAAHCLYPPVGGTHMLPVGNFLVDSINAAGTTLVTTAVTARLKHPKYQSNVGAHVRDDYDVAILTLANIIPTTVPIMLSSTPIPRGQELHIAGFGQTETAALPNRPVLSASLTVVPCPGHIATPDPTVQCLWSTPAKRAVSCAGDSGGPWFTLTTAPKKPVVISGVNVAIFDGACGTANAKAIMGPTAVRATKDWIQLRAPNFRWT